MVQDVSDHII